MALTLEFTMALLGALAIVTLAMFTSQAVRYLVGIGTFVIYLLILFTLTGNIDIAVLGATAIAFSIAHGFDRLMDQDLYSATLVVAISVVGFVLLARIAVDFFCFSRPDANPLTNNLIYRLYRQIIIDFQQALRLLR